MPSLQALCAAGRRPLRVISQPARAVGRGQQVQDPPVAAWAKIAGLEIEQPEKINGRKFRESIEALEPDLCVVVAYGAILTRQLLDVPRLGFINVHASLLPKYRGAAPIQAAIAAGDTEAGVTIMQIEPGLDSGLMLLSRTVPIRRSETTADLGPKLAEAGADLLVDAISRLEFGLIDPEPQDERAATYAPKLTKADGLVSWNLPANEISNRLRAFTPWPGLRAELGGVEVKLLELYVVEIAGDEEPGTILGTEGMAALVRCGDATAAAIRRAQRPGRRPVAGAELIRSFE